MKLSEDQRYRLELAYKKLSPSVKTLLDYGCSDGLFLKKVSKKIPKAKLWGLDVDVEKLKEAKKKVKAKFVSDTAKLPSKFFDVVCLLDVLEHVPDEAKTLSEIYRVLKPNGHLFLSVPHKGLTEIFDPGNVKFRFPKLHRFLYEKVFKLKGYERKYLGDRMIGDITRLGNGWHRHYVLKDLKARLGKKFIIDEVYNFSLFFPILSMLDQAVSWTTKRSSKLLKRLVLLDSRTDYGPLSFSIFIEATKK